MLRPEFPVPFKLRFGRLDSVYIGGSWVKPKERKAISVVDPHSGKEITKFFGAGLNEVNLAVEKAKQAFFGLEVRDSLRLSTEF